MLTLRASSCRTLVVMAPSFIRVQRGAGGFLLGILLTWANTFAHKLSVDIGAECENFVVIRPNLFHNLVEWRCAVETLTHFLQVAFWIAPSTLAQNEFQFTDDMIMDKDTCHVVTLVEVDCANRRLKCVR